MASKSRVSILDYFNIVCEGENGKIESNCKACGTRIQAKRTVTSNFVTHLKVRVYFLLCNSVFYLTLQMWRCLTIYAGPFLIFTPFRVPTVFEIKRLIKIVKKII